MEILGVPTFLSVNISTSGPSWRQLLGLLLHTTSGTIFFFFPCPHPFCFFASFSSLSTLPWKHLYALPNPDGDRQIPDPSGGQCTRSPHLSGFSLQWSPLMYGEVAHLLSPDPSLSSLIRAH